MEKNLELKDKYVHMYIVVVISFQSSDNAKFFYMDLLNWDIMNGILISGTNRVDALRSQNIGTYQQILLVLVKSV